MVTGLIKWYFIGVLMQQTMVHEIGSGGSKTIYGSGFIGYFK